MTGISTNLIHSGYTPDQTGAIIPPLYLSSTFEYGNSGGFEYSRSSNPTRQTLEAVLASLEQARFALAYSSGSAALANIMSLLQKDEVVLFSTDVYGGSYRYFTKVLAKPPFEHEIVDFTDLQAVEAAFKKRPIKILWAETPTNPLLKVVDIRAIADIAHKHGAILVVDNTFLTPVAQRPLEQGADVVAYSTTKFINGHSDSVGGSLVVNDEALYEKLKFLQNAIGAILSPFDSWLTLRGLRTLELRILRHTENAQYIVKKLSNHKKIKKIHYPGLFTGEQAAIVAKQQRYPGSMMSIELQDGVNTDAFLKNLHLFPLAESLGGVESLIDHPATMTHASVPPEERLKIGISDGLFRLSIGIENKEDLLADILGALDKV